MAPIITCRGVFAGKCATTWRRSW